MSKYTKDNPTSIQKMFGSIAQNYDKTNAILSFQMHKKWNQELVRHVRRDDESEVFLDLCCGTGDIAFTYLAQSKKMRKVYLLDFCQEMLECAKEKSLQKGFERYPISYLQADAKKIPLEAKTVSLATLAYGIRNIQNPQECFREVYRVLVPGGRFGILELTRPQNRLLRFGHQIYLKTILPLLGKWLTNNKAAYQYLCSSIHTFVPPSEISRMLQEEGFQQITLTPLFGGVATLFICQKPLLQVENQSP
ncbi:bifunctional demethylmenaquinone methyltransferase/2-methoxy-6-polyprenyl-1,4-benzoquinol methylase UbiE [Parachlamydia sp. AcF125]|uniref:bifunctional demethylmenaquinone methyltransferase/2-methoxy-6-polyprenyl-1,4-benzoquinol methylase UbiE n=1 Tax=Parachlamydia sp. AcF125 TaxID=2795736 RepID=UPI001BC92C6B|nr:bifunctional demethylmenaquinone methyltransferase/2-methoxy-6-polyprenyl-1,4-benzoquinol methylase UbiE [Parachlamydia sp. AcF125]MBS4169221.1 Demethylmenaquinone methyltransferase [Parachlamydia sp. AcF125]